MSNVNRSNVGPPHADFTDRLVTLNIDDDDPDFDWNDKGDITDYFTYNFTLAELLTLRRRQVRVQLHKSNFYTNITNLTI